MEFMNVVKQRRSTRSFKSDPIPENVIRDIIEAGRLAPSPGNSQNWYFGVITDQTQREELAHAAGNQMWVASAPVIIAICTKLEWNLRDLPDGDFGLEVNKKRFSSEFVSYLQQYPDQKAVSTLFFNGASSLPGQQMFLTAINHGLGACWIGYLDIHRANQVLGLPDEITCLNLIPIGYPNSNPIEVERRDTQEIVFINKWE